LHRKNALFYRTLAGAHVGDVFMSLIHTAEINDIAPFEYLVALQRHAAEIAANPSAWMPWNYQTTVAKNHPGPTHPFSRYAYNPVTSSILPGSTRRTGVAVRLSAPAAGAAAALDP